MNRMCTCNHPVEAHTNLGFHTQCSDCYMECPKGLREKIERAQKFLGIRLTASDNEQWKEHLSYICKNFVPQNNLEYLEYKYEKEGIK